MRVRLELFAVAKMALASSAVAVEGSLERRRRTLLPRKRRSVVHVFGVLHPQIVGVKPILGQRMVISMVGGELVARRSCCRVEIIPSSSGVGVVQFGIGEPVQKRVLSGRLRRPWQRWVLNGWKT